MAKLLAKSPLFGSSISYSLIELSPEERKEHAWMSDGRSMRYVVQCGTAIVNGRWEPSEYTPHFFGTYVGAINYMREGGY